MNRSEGRPSIAMITVAAVLVIGGVTGLMKKVGQATDTGRLDAATQAPCEADAACEVWDDVEAIGGNGREELPRAEACADTGYLCAFLEERGAVVIRRWTDDTEKLVVYVPESPSRGPEAREQRLAAIRAIRTWHLRPFPIEIDRSGRLEADLTVEWRRHLTGANMPFANGRWTPQTGLRGLYLELPYEHRNSRRANTPNELEIIAVKEMGHALGLEWSDSERDVMHPDNTLRRPSSRDLRTIEALYSLPNGAWIRNR